MTVPSRSSLLAIPSGRTAARHLERSGVEATHLVALTSYRRVEHVVHLDGRRDHALHVALCA